MRYLWTWWESVTYCWPDWTRTWLAPKRWTNPQSDVTTERRLELHRVLESQPVRWPEELADLRLNLGPPGQEPWEGTVGGGVPMQLVDPNRTSRFRVTGKYSGTRYFRTSEEEDFTTSFIPDWDGYEIDLPNPIQGGWGYEGYPNPANRGDRHWFGLERNGTAHEAIWLNPDFKTLDHYIKYSPTGAVLDKLIPAGTVVKGDIQWTAHALNRGDPPHRLGCVFHNLGHYRDAEGNLIWGDGQGYQAEWEVPAYGQMYRLSDQAYGRLTQQGLDLEQSWVVDSLRYFGVVPYDRGGRLKPNPQHQTDFVPHMTIGLVSGQQWIGSTVAELEIYVSDFELVTKAEPDARPQVP